ncbi:MAG TPA: hypothetical protein H9887_03610, partial [Candidatus Dorea intestinavium]|nr:hypothetical protein [Candidatus Dorea intestinavium]
MEYKRKKNTKRKREVQRNRALLILGMLLMVFLAITIYEVKSHKEASEETKKENKTTAKKIEVQTNEQEDKRKKLPLEERKKLAKEAAASYEHSEDFLWMLDTNDDTIDLVEDYETKKDEIPPETIGEDFV